MTSRSCLARLPLGEGSGLLRLRQNGHALPHRGLGFGAQDSVIIVTDRVWNDRKPEPWPPRDLRRHLGRLHKAVRNDGRGGNPGVLGGDSVV